MSSLTQDVEKIAAPSTLKLNLNLSLAMHRLFTFPLVFHRLFQFELLHFLSDLGFYFSNECIDGNDSENVPMGKSLDDHLNYNYEAHRLYSLLKKNDWQYVTPFDLAKSGFYYSGCEDNVICVFCNLEVRGWEEGDTPDEEAHSHI
ncbi:Hypothetical predicted protein [Cloeon dipterum]|uniref:Uncharacterized protein n=1 Tax=Cloeon dipterum TaxID=197152 RepID=A0A8S1E9J3_9INSE|nr:Hypothetical predicted protein [Cloeon dipterum]